MKTFAFIDASNLFYGGEKSLGWKIDYKKLLEYLKEKYDTSKVFYFGGVDIGNYDYDYLNDHSVPLNKLEKNEEKFLNQNRNTIIDKSCIISIENNLQRIRFYKKLESFGYELFLKPVKIYPVNENGEMKKKANCDVDMTFYLMKEKDNFDKVIILSGDGDFLPVLKYLKDIGKEVIILARGPRTAREIKQFAGSNFRDFTRLEKYIKFKK